jgi:hypothetical protein
VPASNGENSLAVNVGTVLVRCGGVEVREDSVGADEQEASRTLNKMRCVGMWTFDNI